MSEPVFFVHLMTVDITIPWAQSLKDKRSVLRGLTDRLRSRFNASVAEVGYQDKWQRSLIAVCILGNEKRRLESDMARIRQLCEETHDIQITEMHQQWL